MRGRSTWIRLLRQYAIGDDLTALKPNKRTQFRGELSHRNVQRGNLQRRSVHRFQKVDRCAERMGGWNIWHVYRLLGLIAAPMSESPTNSRGAINIISIFENRSHSTIPRWAFIARFQGPFVMKVSAAKSSQVKLLITNSAFFVAQRTTAKSSQKPIFSWLWFSWSSSGFISRLVCLYDFFLYRYRVFVYAPGLSVLN
jgi:hypothetical protein